jgi:N-methylhydantoinase A
MLRVGIDIGGTFTDLMAVDDETGEYLQNKCLTTPDDLTCCFFEVLDTVARSKPGLPLAVVHGTTAATNVLLEGGDHRVAMLTTEGFRDVLEIGRHFRRRVYNLFLEKPPVLVPRDLRLEVPERIDAQGRVVRALDQDSVRAAASKLRGHAIQSVAICFLNAYCNGEHEQEAKRLLSEICPELLLSLSSEVCPESRELERFSTTCVNAIVMPVVDRYLQCLEQNLAVRYPGSNVRIIQSNGGMITPDEARGRPVQLIESGPAAGVLAARSLGVAGGQSNLISFDMGGTTAKVGLIRDGQIAMKNEYRVGGRVHGDDSDGYPIKTPVIDLVEVSAGGGTIASVDTGGALRLGPRSAGARPGPACYGLGGEEPTITDAHIVAGHLQPDYFLGGRMALDVERARDSIQRKIAGPLALTPEEAASGILEVANAHMLRALKLVTVQRGFDPADFTLVAFGGAGPMHAAALAAELNIKTVMIPAVAGVASALGLIEADYRHDYSSPFRSPFQSINTEALTSAFHRMEQKGGAALQLAGTDAKAVRFERSLDVRYVGQAYEVIVRAPNGVLDKGRLRRVELGFHREHKRLFGHNDPGAPIEVVLARLAAIGRTGIVRWRPKTAAVSDCHQRRLYRSVHFGLQGWQETLVVRWNSWRAGESIEGPALVLREDSTLVVPPGWNAQMDEHGNGLLKQ